MVDGPNCNAHNMASMFIAVKAGPVWSESERVWSMFLFDFLISPVKVGMLPSKVRYLDLEGKVNRDPQIFLLLGGSASLEII